ISYGGSLYFYTSIIYWLAILGILLGLGWLIGGLIWEIVDKVQGKPRRQQTSKRFRNVLIGLIVAGILPVVWLYITFYVFHLF
ncbi:MAG: hypothetical protein K940chlam2_00772, partial [Chlamydiae bacterium]|nr:hypothetical protein [Chlamydiota bacterium]